MSSRRVNRRLLLREALGAVREAAPSLLGASPPAPAAPPPPVVPEAPPSLPAPPATAALTDADLEALAAAGGLEPRVADIVAIARRGLRLTHDGSVRALRLGDGRGDPAAIADVALADLPAGLGLPLDGELSFFADLAAPSEWGVQEIECEVQLDDPQPRDAAPTLAVTGELQLPRVWAAAVQALGLDPDEQGAWTALRVRLAEAQGVPPFDLAPPELATHRLLGLPDETGGLMPELCDPEAPERWRLLLQVSRDDAVDWARSRLYFWIEQEALSRADFSGVKAFRA